MIDNDRQLPCVCPRLETCRKVRTLRQSARVPGRLARSAADRSPKASGRRAGKAVQLPKGPDFWPVCAHLNGRACTTCTAVASGAVSTPRTYADTGPPYGPELNSALAHDERLHVLVFPRVVAAGAALARRAARYGADLRILALIEGCGTRHFKGYLPGATNLTQHERLIVAVMVEVVARTAAPPPWLRAARRGIREAVRQMPCTSLTTNACCRRERSL